MYSLVTKLAYSKRLYSNCNRRRYNRWRLNKWHPLPSYAEVRLPWQGGGTDVTARDEMMVMLSKSWENLTIDNERTFKSLFVTNAFDGSEDHLVSDKLYQLIGPQMLQFRETLMKPKAPKTLQQLLRQLIQQKGIHRNWHRRNRVVRLRGWRNSRTGKWRNFWWRRSRRERCGIYF